MKVQYLKEPLLKEDYVDVHYREETEPIALVKDFFNPCTVSSEKRMTACKNCIPAVSTTWKW